MNDNYSQVIDSVLISAKECVEAFGVGDNGLGYKKIIELIEKMEYFTGLLGNLDPSDKEVNAYITKLNSILIQITEALVGKDSILVSDIIEYELIPAVEALKN